MKRLVLFLTVVVFGLSMTPASTPAFHDGTPPAQENWPPLLKCPDVNGVGAVNIPGILEVASHFGASYGHADYELLYDVDGLGVINIPGDIMGTAARFGENCPLVETQVAQAAIATSKYADKIDDGPLENGWKRAQADGYAKSTQYVPQMGIHVSLGAAGYAADFDPAKPIGLIYKETFPGSGQPDEFIGLWYVVPNQEVCDVFLPGTTCDDAEPEAFDGPEDNTNLSSVQQGWHTHENLCFIPGPPISVVEIGPGGSDQDCFDIGGILNFENYGWMAHLYTQIPNPDGRFMMWNFNLS